jgi:hypothetical protein
VIGLGKRILVQFGNGLPMFGGVIDVPRRRLADGISVTVYTGHRILNWRHTQKTEIYGKVSPGTIARSVLLNANAAYYTGIEIGSTYGGGAVRDETYHYQTVQSVISRLQGLSGEDYDIVPVYSRVHERLTFRFDWYKRIGTDRTGFGVALVQGENLQGAPIVDEQGPIAGKVTMVEGTSSGRSWGEKLTSTDEDSDSLDTYGYREFTKIMTDISDQNSLDASAEATLDAMKDGSNRFTMQALDAAPSGFSVYAVGDTVSLTAHQKYSEWGYDNYPVRILSREWRPDNMCRLEGTDG